MEINKNFLTRLSYFAYGVLIGVASQASVAQEAINTNGTNTGIQFSGFLFEPEVPFTSLKGVPTWSELEQLLDNPYLVTLDPATPGNDQGFPSYRATGVQRRPGFGVTLPPLLVHPLNYNTTTGEEMRLINWRFPGAIFGVTDELVLEPGADPALGPYQWTRVNAPISAGAARVPAGATAIDYNNPIPADPGYPGPCVLSLEFNPPEGSTLCGGDPGEPGYFGLGVLRPVQSYSTPAVPLSLTTASPPGTPIPSGAMLFDPRRNTPAQGGVMGFIPARNPLTGMFGLHKPSLRVPSVVSASGTPGRPNNPAYTANTDPDAVTQSNENDFIRDKGAAIALGKALFWDMQVGSDGVQACGSCHFNGTGTDTRTRNQLNPNHIGGDNSLQVGNVDLDPLFPELGKAANYELQASDFPLHKLTNPNIAGDPLCTTGLAAGVGVLTADVSAIRYAGAPGGIVIPDGYLAYPSQRFSNIPSASEVEVCNATNTTSDVNDVVSSMGVVFSPFTDIAPIGAFQPAANGVSAVMPDLRTAGAMDPIPAFNNDNLVATFRRVEPRNTPTMQAAGFNFDNFWDGRARHDFNGGSVFGAGDPQSHVFACGNVNATGTNCQNPAVNFVATRQIIRFSSIASLATGPGLSEFEMSFAGRNWAKIGKKLLQPTQAATPDPINLQGAVTPLANQLVAPTDSVIGLYSNQGGSACAALAVADRSPGWTAAGVSGRPGLCISYPGLIRKAYFPALWVTAGRHLNGCYTDGTNTPQCGGTNPAIPILVRDGTGADVFDETNTSDKFDGYVLSIANNAAQRANRNQFTQMEGNFSLVWGLSLDAWVKILVPDNTPFDQVLDANPGAFTALGEPGEAGLVPDQLNCGQADADPNHCFTPVGNFRRDPGVVALQNPQAEGGAGGTLVEAGGNRNPGDPDPLLGLDIFFASNLSLKNPNFRTGRCGECHAIPTLTDHTMPFTSKINLMDAVNEFVTPGQELIVEPLARLRVITGFLLEAEINENGQDAVERRFVDQSLIPHPIDGLAYPGGLKNPTGTEVLNNDGGGIPSKVAGDSRYTGADASYLDNGMYNLGVRPIHEDTGRGGNDAFGWPLSIATLMMKNLEGAEFNPGGDAGGDVIVPGAGTIPGIQAFLQPTAPGNAITRFDPTAECFGLFEESAQDQQINPGCEGEPADPLLPAYLGDFANNITVGDFPPEMDEAGGAIGGMVNTLTDVAMIEGFMDTLGPFNPGNIAAEVLNFGGFSDRFGDNENQMGTWPNVNRVGRMGSFKAPQLRNVELTGPYFHNGGKLTLRQVVDFYTRGGDFPISNAAHRDFNLVNMNIEIQSNLNEDEKVALVDFLLELTDERNLYDRAPFDHPEVIIPVDGLAPDNTTGRTGLLANPMFRSVPAVGAAGQSTPEPAFLNVTKVRVTGDAADPGSAECNYATGSVSQYCH